MTETTEQAKHGGNNNPMVVPFLVNLAISGTASGIGKTFVAPIERVKLILQTQASSRLITKETQYKGIVDAFIRLPREQGLASMWRGNLANVLRYFPAETLSFAFKDKFKQIFVGRHDPKTDSLKYFWGTIASGGAAGATSLLLVYPLVFAHTRMAVDVGKGATREFTSLSDCIKKIYRNDGLRGLYRGFGASVQGIIVYRAVLFGCYDTVKHALINQPQNAPFWKTWLIAQSVTTVAGFAAYPLDTVSRRMMLQSGRSAAELQYSSTLDCWRKIFVNEGPRAFYRGMLLHMMNGAGGALMLVLYDKLRN